MDCPGVRQDVFAGPKAGRTGDARAEARDNKKQPDGTPPTVPRRKHTRQSALRLTVRRPGSVPGVFAGITGTYTTVVDSKLQS